MVENDWHWLAGIFEGEGTAGLRWGKKRCEGSIKRAYLYFSISQRETSMLLEVQRIAGCGKIYNANRKDGGVLFAWYCACAQARAVMTKLLPFIRSHHKREQVIEALNLDREMRIAGRQRMLETLAIGRRNRYAKVSRG
jgi:hypothetical protein